MRMLMLSASLLAAVAATTVPGRAADIYPPAYGEAPAPRAYVPPPAYGYSPPQPYAYAAPPVYVRPPGVVVAPEGPAYVVPGPVYQPGDEYVQAPVAVDGRRYYRDCWWDWGYRRCVLKPRGFAW